MMLLLLLLASSSDKLDERFLRPFKNAITFVVVDVVVVVVVIGDDDVGIYKWIKVREGEGERTVLVDLQPS